MTKSILFSLSYPNDPAAQKIFEHRVVRFFDYSTSNMFSLIIGASVIALVLMKHGTAKQSIFLYYVFTAALAIASYFTCQYAQKKQLNKSHLSIFIKIRVALGCTIGFMYASAVLILPEGNINEGILFLLCIYIVSIAIAIFQYSVIPTYYILYTLSIYIPLICFIFITANQLGPMVLLLIVSSCLMLISKGLKVSKTEINLIEVNLNLQIEAEEHRITRKKLQEMAFYDNLTKVANRHSFEDKAKDVIQTATENNQQLAILFIDLNNFKTINDTFGHEVGDKVLKLVANKIKRNIRSSDTVARFGGDEFVIILEDYKLKQVNKKHIEAIRSTLNESILIDEHVIELRASIGISVFPRDGDNLKQLLLSADSKMYKQKQKRNAALN